ncbi:uncharacterized protein ACLA_005770 [Aspergillus clavatus NRRL 1]|uniref:Uncharacterized protein n=1 Tax=Aspergillus clavatus (strain ATCC 1007 / CBS 513.65 / DSM 816 / NCTC 3887 / NRRL 1 / QM 1276 / 107) TaxID=344612 RepID=A1CD94_ASPCL|nr:uncharacterized protein ACLA_005770 [Aspergillus clavatus NRRL 1]EAW11821.1 hypothetical protein ACLA_005770 [Aspergillus clavatus NRRL 1]
MDIDGEKEIKRQTNNEITHTWPGSGKNNGSFQPSPISNHFRINQFLSFTEQPNTLSTYKKLQDQENQREDPAFRKDLLSSWSDQRFPSPISENNNVMTCDKFPNSDIEMTSSASRSASSALFASQVGPKLQHDPNSYQGPPQQDLLSINALGQGQQLISRPNTPSRKKKVTLSMGFRADCDKCLHKVPGHYSHIIRT